MSASPKYPDIHVQLTGEDGNTLSILGRITKALRKGGASGDEVLEFQREMLSGDYDHALQTAMKWVAVS